MSSFDARLRIPGQTRLPVGVVVDISDEGLCLMSGERTIAEWPLEELVARAEDGEFYIKVDGEEMILKVDDASRFALELGVADAQPAASPASNGVAAATGSTLNRSAIEEERFEELKSKVKEVEEGLNAEGVDPSLAFRRWLRMLKDINRRHGQGSLTTHQFYLLNSQLLELIPEPASTHQPAEVVAPH